MADYQAPLKDMNFLLYDVFSMEAMWQSMPTLSEHVDRETAQAILQECAKIAEQEIAPLSRQGDEIGVSFNEGKVTTAPGYKEAFKTYADGGWTGLGGEPDFGGMGMPKVITALHEEMLCSADIAFSLYPGLTAGAGLSIAKHATDELKERYLTRLYAGDWMATMCLTEPHSGTDLGLIYTKAVPEDDGSFAISGTKIFITAGEHDITENIVHLVLAKLPGAPAGPRGISLFLVPKYQVNDDESLGDFNNVSCGSIEHKMGIHASATCVMNFDSSKGYLVGEENKGLACMFTMMNFERIGVGIQGIGAAERSYQNALEYAKERLQGRSLSGAKYPEKAADPIIVHGDVRRMLLNMKALTEGSRALSTYISMTLDMATYGEGELKTKGESLSALMTPLAKAFFTDLGLDNTVAGQQVLGGHGYIREWGQEQLVRDVRIAQIYEGTNGIQAMDLLARKVAASKGELMQTFINEVNTYIEQTSADNMQEFIQPLKDANIDLAELTQHILKAAQGNIEELGTSANDYLHVFGYTAMAFVWAKMAESALAKESSSDEFYESKIKTARYYFARLLPRRLSLTASIKAGCDTLFDIDESLF
ncbi:MULTISPECIES: acyl-CoA dehydrogenase C-terminal domain-containing protein [unclassified Colwellia]|uniref:acyl-CoA dehydrogenase C-terminal domain-containing protein n=1 Tax=unclassified Colwellia TaxID=196834 RepID=UPI0015F363F0|nr:MULTISPECIES: acyl-CoA dehydrogenase C-terminal domain-containing protein [unclassified Colwellia]MBA6363236.1 acyl-CoA dehydrogenase C-terminal domain-containing protein [Colwellia sp. BRX8-8]MBA6336877.1 acyl-CoA dehydrogenase C-terminal domain-containing protein [Colwellia sp. BRX8-7]MBA6348252.1 acyl-CoA dehydrogenase C-terminal domain-containing protein [Colwellia sp. BRX8-9]MBA6351436.1 acyl-CoA dehydrogenase C-terminal domain-containing protein [Colwellia sp. BRX9-1]MBA6354667.1 acyl